MTSPDERLGCEITARSIKRTLQPRYIVSRKAGKAEPVSASEGKNCVGARMMNPIQDFSGVRKMGCNESLLWNWRDPAWLPLSG